MTPSGAPPVPITAWTPVPETAHEIAADRSPSPMSLIRAPACRTSAMRASWRGRSRMTTVMSPTRRPSALAMRRRFSVGLSRMSTLPRRHRPDAQLLHVGVRGMGQPARLGGGEDRDRARLAVGDEVGALERVDRDVHARDVVAIRAGPPDPLADVQHRRLVALALADDDPSGEVDLVHRPAHRLGRGRIGGVLLALTHEPRRFDRGGLRHPDHLEREQLLHRSWPSRPPSAWRELMPEMSAAGEDHRRGGCRPPPRSPSRPGSSRPAG